MYRLWPECDAPTLGHAALDHHLAEASGHVAPGDDGVAPPPAEDHLGRGPIRTWPLAAIRRWSTSSRVAKAATSGSARIRALTRLEWLGIKAHDDVGQVGGAHRAVKAVAQAVGDDHGGGEHRRGERDPDAR